MERHKSLHQDISTLEVKIKEMTNTAQTMSDQKHFLKDELPARSKGLDTRYVRALVGRVQKGMTLFETRNSALGLDTKPWRVPG